MVVAKQQLAIVGLKTQAEADAEAADEAARREHRGILRHRLMAALRDYARLRQLNICATELDKDDAVYGGGKGVSSSTLRSCLESTQGNYFRLDWLFWFAGECDEVADILMEIAGHKSEKTPEQELEDLKNALRSEYPKQAAALIRKGQLPRSSR
jgi:hypothetical protein